MKLVGGESFHRGPEYGKMYWDNRKGVGVQRSLSSQLSDTPDVLHLDVPGSSHSQPAQHFIHSLLLQTRPSSQNSASGVDPHQGCNSPRLATSLALPSPQPHHYFFTLQSVNCHLQGGRLSSPTPCLSFSSRRSAVSAPHLNHQQEGLHRASSPPAISSFRLLSSLLGNNFLRCDFEDVSPFLKSLCGFSCV